ncbi:hypothetical protein C8Q78DRAFT_1083106 [Trametes maxima]|nr:hypothetical protein C8Q78DRAFT_1083106 [Trametes maxima]
MATPELLQHQNTKFFVREPPIEDEDLESNEVHDFAFRMLVVEPLCADAPEGEGIDGVVQPGTCAVAPDGTVFYKWRDSRGWGLLRVPIQDIEITPPAWVGALLAVASESAGFRVEILPQDCYALRGKNLKEPCEDITVPYQDVPLSRALKGDVEDEDKPAFDSDSKFGCKLSVCFRFHGSTYNDSNFVKTPQYNAWFARDATKTPILRGKLASVTAQAVWSDMETRPLIHNGQAVSFDRLVLRELRLKSRATFQAEIGVLV